MPSLLDDSYTTADVLGLIRKRAPAMPVYSLSGRERYGAKPPVAQDDPFEATKAMALGAVDFAQIPSAVAGLYSPDLQKAMRGPQDEYPAFALGGAALSTGALLKILGMVPRGLAALTGGTVGMTANGKQDGDQR